MTEVPVMPGREPGSLVRCPRCLGTGRIGEPADAGEPKAACTVCWCRGQIEFWRWQQLIDDERRQVSALRIAGRAAREGAPSGGAGEPEEAGRESGRPEPGRRTDARELADAAYQAAACSKCAPVDRCPQCPFGPFVLAA